MVNITNAYPLLHTDCMLSPFIEIGFNQVQEKCKQHGDTSIVGFYYAKSSSTASSTEIPAHVLSILSTIQTSHFANSVLLLLDEKNCKATSKNICFRLSRGSDPHKFLDPVGSVLLLSDHISSVDALPEMVSKRLHTRVTDFDEYLDDESRDWDNRFLN